MKKNLTKLALSGAALAAVAATLGTSTYAWYTTNPTVSANNIVAGTSDTGSSSIFIAKERTGTKKWSSSVTLTSADFLATPDLTPVSYANTGKFSALDSSTGKLATSAPAGGNVAHIQLFFKSSKVADNDAQSIYIKSITVENTTGTSATVTTPVLPTADNLLYDAAAASETTVGGVSNKASTYSVDFRNALALAVYNAGTQSGSGSYDDAFSIASYKTGTDPEATVTSGDAQGYYDAVMETNLDSGAKAAADEAYDKGAIAICPVNGTNFATVDFYIYLDGASAFCYDACQGQDFKISLEFTSDSTKALGNA